MKNTGSLEEQNEKTQIWGRYPRFGTNAKCLLPKQRRNFFSRARATKSNKRALITKHARV